MPRRVVARGGWSAGKPSTSYIITVLAIGG